AVREAEGLSRSVRRLHSCLQSCQQPVCGSGAVSTRGLHPPRSRAAAGQLGVGPAGLTAAAPEELPRRSSNSTPLLAGGEQGSVAGSRGPASSAPSCWTCCWLPATKCP